MKRLFYIFHDNLGENLFATPCLELLEKKYEIIVLMKEWMIPFFKDYRFISKIIPIEKLEKYKLLFEEKGSLYAYHNDKQKSLLKDKFKNIKAYDVVGDSELNVLGSFHTSPFFMSRTRQYMLKLKLMKLEEAEQYDCKIRIPKHKDNINSGSIIIYQGSREIVRSLSQDVLLKFWKKFPFAIYLIHQKNEEFIKKLGAKYIVIDPIDEKSYTKIVDIFSSGPRCMIGPDSALTQLALGYDIPQVWLQTRIKLEQVIDPQYRSLCKIYLKSDLTCDKKCIGCATYKSLGCGMYELQSEITRHEKLVCIKNKTFSCTEYNEKDINNIHSIVMSL